MMVMHLMGSMSKWSKKPIPLHVNDIPMAMSLLGARFGARFTQQIREGHWHVTKKKLKDCTKFDDGLNEDEVRFSQRDDTHIYITPPTKVSGNTARIIIGVVLIVVGFFFPVAWGLAFEIGGTTAGAIVGGMGVSLALGGVVGLLSPKPAATDSRQQSGQNASFMFNGTVNVTEQGGPVPITYGRVPRASSLVLSAGITSENIAPEVNQTNG